MDNEKALKTLMQTTRFFKSFNDDEKFEILKCCTSVSEKDGDVIFREKSTGDELYILITGSVIIEKEGRRVDVIRSGECFGEMGALTDKERSATAKASGDVVLLAINEKKVQSMKPETQVTFYKSILIITADRLRERLEDRAAPSKKSNEES